MRTLLGLLPIIVFIGCGPSRNPNAPTDNDQCPAAEKKLLELQCRDPRGELIGGPNKHGVPFRDRCVETQNTAVPLNPTCLAKINDCKEVDPCLQAP